MTKPGFNGGKKKVSKHNTFLFRASQIPDLLPALWALKCVIFFLHSCSTNSASQFELVFNFVLCYTVMRTYDHIGPPIHLLHLICAASG